MQKKLHIKKGDTVIVISGNYRGQKGRVLEIVRKTDKAIVEGVNMIKKHSRQMPRIIRRVESSKKKLPSTFQT